MKWRLNVPLFGWRCRPQLLLDPAPKGVVEMFLPSTLAVLHRLPGSRTQPTPPLPAFFDPDQNELFN